LQAFSDACLQRHEAHHVGHPGPLLQWPSGTAFRSWPEVAEIAFPLIVADWKVGGAAAYLAGGEPLLREYRLMNGETLEVAAEMDAALLDPEPSPEVDWHDTYAAELTAAPAIAADLAHKLGDGIELVLERAHLSSGERAVMRAWLYNPDLAQIATDLGWRPQTVGMLHRNALYRLRWLGDQRGGKNQRGDVRRRNEYAGAARAGDVSRSAPARRGAESQLDSSGRSSTGRFRGMSAATA
jgi:hypothetical protein